MKNIEICLILPSFPILNKSKLVPINFVKLFHHAFRIRLNLLHMASTARANTVRADTVWANAVWAVEGIKAMFLQLKVSHTLTLESETSCRTLQL